MTLIYLDVNGHNVRDIFSANNEPCRGEGDSKLTGRYSWKRDVTSIGNNQQHASIRRSSTVQARIKVEGASNAG